MSIPRKVNQFALFPEMMQGTFLRSLIVRAPVRNIAHFNSLTIRSIIDLTASTSPLKAGASSGDAIPIPSAPSAIALAMSRPFLIPPEATSLKEDLSNTYTRGLNNAVIKQNNIEQSTLYLEGQELITTVFGHSTSENKMFEKFNFLTTNR